MILQTIYSVFSSLLASCGMEELRISITPLKPQRPRPLIPHNLFLNLNLIDFLFQPLNFPNFIQHIIHSFKMLKLVFFFFCFKVLLTFPNTLQFHLRSFSWQFFKRSIIIHPLSLITESHTSSINSLHPTSLVYIASKKNLFLVGLCGCRQQWRDSDNK